MHRRVALKLVELESLPSLDPSSSMGPPSTSSTPPAATIVSSTATSEPSKVASSSSATHLTEESLYQHLKSFVKGASENWKYAIFWQSCDDDARFVWGWGNGYCEKGVDGPQGMVTLGEQQLDLFHCFHVESVNYTCLHCTMRSAIRGCGS